MGSRGRSLATKKQCQIYAWSSLRCTPSRSQPMDEEEEYMTYRACIIFYIKQSIAISRITAETPSLISSEDQLEVNTAANQLPYLRLKTNEKYYRL